MISVSGVTVAFGGFTLLDDIHFHLSAGEKVGLVGKNGAGKSTLMKLICGLQSPTSGRIEKPDGLRIGYLPQIMEHPTGRTVLEEAMTVFADRRDREAELDAVNAELARRTDYESPGYARLIERSSQLSDVLSVESGEPPQVRAEKTLLGLGFRDGDFDRPTDTFSQGWKMRLELAKILLSGADVLLLDEPTNHLDIESIEWLEAYLKKFPGALLLVSHDRRFLDNVTGRTIEVLLGHIHDYKVPYSRYVALREERIAQQTAAWENQQRMIEKTEAFIAQFRYKPTKSNQVQSRIKALEKLQRVEIDETDRAVLTVKFPPAPRSGDVAYQAVDLSAGYPPKVVFRDANLEIRRGEKVALVGRNGEGKTTLIRVLTGQLPPLAGTSRTGHLVKVGYYAQDQEDTLDPDRTVSETLEAVAVGEIRTRLRDILAQFLFRGDDVDKKVSVLSGGERARLAMARLMLQPCNLLVLDEPTNHMDIRSKDILKQALRSYDGTLVAVSHDRDFLDGLVDKVYEFRDGKVKEYLGGVEDFLSQRRVASLQELERRFPSAPSPRAESREKAVAAPSRTAFEERRSLTREDRKRRNRITFLEKEIARLEADMHRMEAILSAPGPSDDVMELTRAYLEDKRSLDACTEEWIELQDKV